MTTVLTVRLDDDVSDALTQRATELSMTKAKLVRRLINADLSCNTLREDETMVVFDIEELGVIQLALEFYLKQKHINDYMDLYFYVTRQLADLQISLNKSPYIF